MEEANVENHVENEKALVIGHSWVTHLEEGFNPDWLSKVSLKVTFAGYSGATLDTLIHKVGDTLDETFSYVILFALITEAYEEKEIEDSYRVIVPDVNFSLPAFLNKYQLFQDTCKLLCPNIRFILIVPPLLDLVYHHQLVLKTAPRRLQQKYADRENMIYASARDRFLLLETLIPEKWSWDTKGTTVYGISHAVKSVFFKRKRFEEFCNGDVRTLGQCGYLKDGINPLPKIMRDIWRGLQLSIRRDLCSIKNATSSAATSASIHLLITTARNASVSTEKEVAPTITFPQTSVIPNLIVRNSASKRQLIEPPKTIDVYSRLSNPPVSCKHLSSPSTSARTSTKPRWRKPTVTTTGGWGVILSKPKNNKRKLNQSNSYNKNKYKSALSLRDWVKQ